MDLWKDSDKIIAFLKSSPVRILILDFDGTLAPIVNTPEEASLSREMKNALEGLSSKKDLYLAILSGRSLEDLKKKVNIKNIIYGGTHGLEGEILHEKYVFPVCEDTLSVLKVIQKELRKTTALFKGVLIEDKKTVLSFHYRLAGKQIPDVEVLFNKVLEPYIRGQLISIVKGKMVFDIYPDVNWNKGSFAKLIIERVKAKSGVTPTVLFIGDDTTDEDVFRMWIKALP